MALFGIRTILLDDGENKDANKRDNDQSAKAIGGDGLDARLLGARQVLAPTKDEWLAVTTPLKVSGLPADGCSLRGACLGGALFGRLRGRVAHGRVQFS